MTHRMLRMLSISLKNRGLKMRLLNRNEISNRRTKRHKRPSCRLSKMLFKLRRRQSKPVLRKKSLRKKERLLRNR